MVIVFMYPRDLCDRVVVIKFDGGDGGGGYTLFVVV